VLGLYTREEHEFKQDEIEFLSTLAGQAAIAIYNAQLFEQVNRQTRELEKANSIKEEFLGVMSHELRTPLNITMGYVGMMKDGMLGEISQEQRTALQKVMNQTADQLRMINDILVTSHLESRAMVVDRDRIDLSDLFNSLKSDFDVMHDNDEPELIWNFPSAPVWVVTDRRKLRQIVQNLVSNALKFTERGRIAISLRVPAPAPDPLPVPDRQKDGQPETSMWLEMKVSDTGIGIPPDKLDTIFEKFRQVDSSATRLYGGLGLGLYIVREFTEMLGGKITVESEAGHGSTFTVTIPVGT
jgi:signal transduction histidine kinase